MTRKRQAIRRSDRTIPLAPPSETWLLRTLAELRREAAHRADTQAEPGFPHVFLRASRLGARCPLAPDLLLRRNAGQDGLHADPLAARTPGRGGPAPRLAQ